MTDTRQIQKIESYLKYGQWEKAESYCQTLLKTEPDHPEVLKKLGIAFYFQHDWFASVDALRKSVTQCSDDNEALHWLLAACRDAHDTAGMYEAALKLRGNPWTPDDELGVYEAFEDACAWSDAVAVQKRALALPREGKITADQLPYLMVLLNHVPDISPAIIYDIYRVWGDTTMQQANGIRLAEETPPTPPSTRMKIAYLSADFREHPIGKFMRTIFASHDHHRFEIYCYVHTLGDDAITDEIRLASDHFIDITKLDNEALARRIHADGIHILIEIGGHMAHSRLAALAWKPAPIQITYLAQPNTTALPTVDFRITDANSEAPGGTNYVEKQLYMPESFLCMGHLPDFDRITTTPAEENGYITFASFNGIRKFNPAVISLWCKILRRVKKSKLVIKSPGTSVPIVRGNIMEEFNRNGIQEDRLEFVEYCTFQEHADWHNKIDIALDSFPYNGTTTTFDTLWMGVPVVTLVGKLHAQRTSYTILKNIGFDEAAAAFSPEEYVNKAVHLAEHPETLSFLRRCLPTMIKNSIMFQPERFTMQMEALYIRAWEDKMGVWQRAATNNASQKVRHKHNDAPRSETQKTSNRFFIAGMPRSGEAWLHRVITTIIQQQNKEDTQANVQFLYALTGETLQVIQSENTTIFYTQRDLRDVAIAFMDIYGIPFGDALMDSHLQYLIADNHAWTELPQTHTISYEHIVNTPEQVVQHIGKCIGYEISDTDAKSAVESCRQISDHVDMDHPSTTQTETSEYISEFKNDPPGIYLNRLNIEQVGRLNIEFRNYLEKHNYLAPSYPNAGASKSIQIQIQGNLTVCMPATITQRSTYILLEQEDWHEPEIRFLRRWVSPGMHCADIGAGFGCFTLVMGKQTGNEGRLWACEPAESMADLLHRSIEVNHLNHCRLIRMAASSQRGETHIRLDDSREMSTIDDSQTSSHTVSQMAVTGLIDDLATTHQWEMLDFIRINGGEHVNRILEGGQTFFRNHSPLVMVRFMNHTKAQHINALKYMAKLDYSAYQLVSGLMVLVPYHPNEKGYKTPYHIFFCKKNRGKKLRQSGLLISSEYLQQIRASKEDVWQQFSCQFPYMGKLASAWNHENTVNIPEHKAYTQILNMYAAAWQKNTSAQKRIAGLQRAFARLSDLLNSYTNLPRLLTLVRIAIDLDDKDTVCQASDSVIRHLSEGHQFIPEEPFLTASTWAETIDPGEHPAEWCLAQTIHARIRYGELSSWYTQANKISLLETFRQCGFPDAYMERCRQLILMRCGLQGAPAEHSELIKAESSENLNPDFWQGKPSLVSNPTWEFMQEAKNLPYLCSIPKSGNTMVRIVLEHYFQQPVPSVYAGDASILFNEGREHAAAIKCHSVGEAQQGSKLIYIHRDPRDVLISLFKWKHTQMCTEAPEVFETFIKEWAVTWKTDIQKAQNWSGEKLIVGYADIVTEPMENISDILSFMGETSINKDQMSTAIAYASKEKIADALTTFGTVKQQLMPLEHKTSRWRDILSPAQVALIQNIVGTSLLKTLGYPVQENHERAVTGKIEVSHNTENICPDDIYHHYHELDKETTQISKQRSQRMDEAKRWMQMSPLQIEAALKTDHTIHANIMNNGLKRHLWTEAETLLVEGLRQDAEQAIIHGDTLQYAKSTIVAMLYCFPHQFPLVTNLAIFPAPFIEKYMTFVMGMFDIPHEHGEAEQYTQVITDWVETVAQYILSTDGAEPWLFVARQIMMTYNTFRLYMVDKNWKRFYTTRARLYEFYFKKSDMKIDYTMPPRPRDRKKIRIAFIIAHLGPATETYGTLSIYENMDREIFDIRLFAFDSPEGDLAQYCIGCVDQFTFLPAENNTEKSIAMLRDCDLDIAVFGTNVTAVYNSMSLISMHRFARIQIPYASATTTGFKHADYFISGSLSEPVNAQDQYSERLEMFDGHILCYSLAGQAIEPTVPAFQREDMGIPDDAVVYISGANFYKILPEVEDTWLRILNSVPNAILLLYPLNPNWLETYPLLAFWDRLKRSCIRHKIDDTRIQIIKKQHDRDNIFRILKCADIYLDSFPFSGGTSIIDPLRVSLPTVVMTGHSMRCLNGQGALFDLQLNELVTENIDAYINLAVSLGKDSERRQYYATRIREIMQKRPTIINPKPYVLKYTEVLKRIAHRHGFFPREGEKQSLGELQTIKEIEAKPKQEGVIS